MKKQICFAGFTDLELEALQPALTGLGASWNCVFSPDAASALEAMASTPFDATIVNLSKSGITDSNILQEAARSHPRTLRFVLGDVSERELIVNCMGAAHQFVSRPWKPPELISIIERSLALDAWLSNDKLRTFIPRLGTLPSLPSTYFEVIKRAESPNSSVESVSEVIARDPALTARLLQMVNSPACGLTEKITNPQEAVSRMGLEMVKSFVLCLQLFTESSPSGASISLDDLWKHSFSVAKIAAKIVLHCISSERMASDAYTAGLLHNIGQIVLATNLSAEYSAVVNTARKTKSPLAEVEMELLGVTSNQVGAYLLGLWGMPLPLVEATALHAAPGLVKPVEFTVLTVVHVANVLAYEEHGPISKLQSPKLDTEYLSTLNLPTKTDAWRKLLASNPRKEPEPVAPEPRRSSSPVRMRAEKSGSAFGLKAALAAVVIILAAGGVFVFKRNGGHWPGASKAPAHSASPVADGDDQTAPAADSGSPWESVKLQSILYTSTHPMAVVNGQTLEVGGKVNGVQVLAISRTNVILACNGEQRSFALK